jgi:hypothetical protein
VRNGRVNVGVPVARAGRVAWRMNARAGESQRESMSAAVPVGVLVGVLVAGVE